MPLLSYDLRGLSGGKLLESLNIKFFHSSPLNTVRVLAVCLVRSSIHAKIGTYDLESVS